MNVLKFSYYSMKDPNKVGIYYAEKMELPDNVDDALIKKQIERRISLISDSFLSDFCIKNHLKRTDILPRIEFIILKDKKD